MSATEQAHESELWRDEHAKVVSWRIETLQDAGYSRYAAVTLGHSDDVDLHRACDLLAFGCGEKLALAILL